jgi:hypothetical protein
LISTPLSLIFGPTISLLPISLVLLLFDEEDDDDAAEWLPIGWPTLDAVAAPGGTALANGELGEFVSRFPKRVSERSMGSPEDKAAAKNCPDEHGDSCFNVMGNLLITLRPR